MIDCLEDPDETLRRKTLELLYKMTNPDNVEVIVDKLMHYLRTATEQFLKSELVTRISSLAERYARSNAWYLATMNQVFELGGALVRPDVVHHIAHLISVGGSAIDGSADCDPADDIRCEAVSTYLSLIKKDGLSESLLRLICWTLGEFSHWKEGAFTEAATGLVDILLDNGCDSNVRGYALSALSKLTAKNLGSKNAEVFAIIKDAVMKFQNSVSTDLQQRCYEYLELVKTPSLMQKAYGEDDVEENLSFLDSYVAEAVSNGAPSYVDHHVLKVNEYDVLHVFKLILEFQLD